MNLLPSFKVATSSMLCAAVVGCAGSVEPATPIVVRTPAPKNYEKTITNYLAFRIRNPPKNAEISVGAPEPGACALDGYVTSTRGWVVPVLYVTRTGEVKEAIRIDAKQYYFWFLGNTIAGITPRMELCPGVGTGFESPQPNPAAGALLTTALPVTTNAEPRREEAAGGQKTTKQKNAAAAKKSSASSPKTRPALKKKASSSKPKPD